jgi:cysteine desulfurase family protein (TIGR01976 family)
MAARLIFSRRQLGMSDKSFRCYHAAQLCRRFSAPLVCEKLSAANSFEALENVMGTPALHETISKSFDIAWVREQFPSLQLQVNGQPAAFLDGPAGTQVPRQVMDAVQKYFLEANANTYGAFLTSRRTNEMVSAARAAMADLFNCAPDEVVFGQNMTTITLGLSRAIGRELQPGDEILLTMLDHDANFSPWKALEEKGVVIRKVEIRESDCTLDLDDLKSKLNSKTRLVAVGYASNAVGSINPVAKITKLAHAAGAMCFIDAVHYAPHGPMDVKALDCDFLVCSPYKFFGPHMGTLYGKKHLLEKFKPYKVRPAADAVPECWETGTQVQELIAGVHAAVEYIAELGRRCDPSATDRRSALLAAYRSTVAYERALVTRLIEGLLAIPGLRFFGITDPERFAERCSTVSFRLAKGTPTDAATFLGDRGIFTWDGNFYALNLTECLGVEQHGGVLRVGLVHYNTTAEVDRLLAAVRDFAFS